MNKVEQVLMRSTGCLASARKTNPTNRNVSSSLQLSAGKERNVWREIYGMPGHV